MVTNKCRNRLERNKLASFETKLSCWEKNQPREPQPWTRSTVTRLQVTHSRARDQEAGVPIALMFLS